jgi:hypothetical protein
MSLIKALERWERKIGNTEVTSQAICPIAKCPLKRYGPKASIAIHGPSGLNFIRPRKKNQLLTA